MSLSLLGCDEDLLRSLHGTFLSDQQTFIPVTVLTMFIHYARKHACDNLKFFIYHVYIYIKISYVFIQFVCKTMNRVHALRSFHKI